MGNTHINNFDMIVMWYYYRHTWGAWADQRKTNVFERADCCQTSSVNLLMWTAVHTQRRIRSATNEDAYAQIVHDYVPHLRYITIFSAIWSSFFINNRQFGYTYIWTASYKYKTIYIKRQLPCIARGSNETLEWCFSVTWTTTTHLLLSFWLLQW